MSDATEELVTTTTTATKKERSAAQLQSLARAREKAAEVRAKNTEWRRKEREQL